MTTTDKPFDFQFGTEEPTIKGAIFQALGAASVAWSETPTGVFDSEYATEVGNKLLEFIHEAVGKQVGLNLLDDMQRAAEKRSGARGEEDRVAQEARDALGMVTSSAERGEVV